VPYGFHNMQVDRQTKQTLLIIILCTPPGGEVNKPFWILMKQDNRQWGGNQISKTIYKSFALCSGQIIKPAHYLIGQMFFLMPTNSVIALNANSILLNTTAQFSNQKKYQQTVKTTTQNESEEETHTVSKVHCMAAYPLYDAVS